LALNPEQQRFLHEEIDEVFGDDDGKSSDDEV
jgi:hypothetical protein